MQALVVMLVISALVFVGVYAVGNPIDVMISPDVTQEIREQTIRAYGFDLPLWQQYGIFLQRLFTGDFGRSFVYNMPVLDGIGMLRRLRDNPETKRLPVIMLTANSSPETIATVARLGVRDYITKPFDDAMLVSKVAKVVSLVPRATA